MRPHHDLKADFSLLEAQADVSNTASIPACGGAVARQWRSARSGEAKLPPAVRLSMRSQTGAVIASTAFVLRVSATTEIAAQPRVTLGNASKE